MRVITPEKLTEILKHNNINSVTVVRMDVPCCGGIAMLLKLLCRIVKANSMVDCNHLTRWSNYRKLGGI